MQNKIKSEVIENSITGHVPNSVMIDSSNFKKKRI